MIKSRRIRLTGHVALMGRRGMHIGIWLESQKEIDHYEDLDVGRTDLREIGWGVMDRNDLAQDRDQWSALANTVMNLRRP
jgi:hypothetical protein